MRQCSGLGRRAGQMGMVCNAVNAQGRRRNPLRGQVFARAAAGAAAASFGQTQLRSMQLADIAPSIPFLSDRRPLLSHLPAWGRTARQMRHPV